MNLQDLDKIRLYKKVDGTFWYVNAAGQWQQFVVGGGGDCCGGEIISEGNVTIESTGGDVTVQAEGTLYAEAIDGIIAESRGNISIESTEGNVEINSPSGNVVVNGVKVYEALLTQQVSTQNSGVLVVGRAYLITSLEAGDNFSNVGYVADGVIFTATGNTPTDWTNGTVVVDVADSAPVATVLENSLGSVQYTYLEVGVFTATLTGQFTENKTLVIIGQTSLTDRIGASVSNLTENKFTIYTNRTDTGVFVNNGLTRTPLIIKVYP